jgi:hypothetical protein
MRYLALAALLALPNTAEAAEAARIGAGSWVVAAALAEDADRVCFEVDGVRVSCSVEVPQTDGVVEFGGQRFKLTPPTPRAAVAALELSTSGTVRAVACRTVDGVELCSAPSSDSYTLTVAPVPAPPTLIDVEAIREALDAIDGAVDKIRDALGAN